MTAFSALSRPHMTKGGILLASPTSQQPEVLGQEYGENAPLPVGHQQPSSLSANDNMLRLQPMAEVMKSWPVLNLTQVLSSSPTASKSLLPRISFFHVHLSWAENSRQTTDKMVQDDAAQPKTWVHVALGLQASAWCWHKCKKTLGSIVGTRTI